MTFESEALGSSELVVSQDCPLPKPGRGGPTSGFFAVLSQMHRWHDRGSGGKFTQRGGFFPILDGVEGDESRGEGLEDERAQEGNHDPRNSTRPEEEESQADKSTSEVSSDNIKHQYDLTPKNRKRLQTL